MSYCRWSKDCDIYMYGDAQDGYTVHVSGPGRRLGSPVWLVFTKWIPFRHRVVAIHDWCSEFVTKILGPRRSIGSCDHTDYHRDTTEEAISLMGLLELDGYSFPKQVYERLALDMEDIK